MVEGVDEAAAAVHGAEGAFRGAGGAVPQAEVAAALFARADGEVEWRLLLTTDALVVNCRSYTRWKDVWTVIRDLFADIASTMHSREQKIKSVVLEYVDLFAFAKMSCRLSAESCASPKPSGARERDGLIGFNGAIAEGEVCEPHARSRKSAAIGEQTWRCCPDYR